MQLDQPASLRIVTRPRLLSIGRGDSLAELDVREFAEKGTVANVVDPVLPTGEALYYLDRASAAPVVVPNVIAATGGGRWLIISGGGGGGITAAANVGGGAGEVFRNIVAGVLNLRTLTSPDSTVSVVTNGDLIELRTQAYRTVEDEGVPLPQRTTLNFVGGGVTVTDAGGETVVTIPGAAASAVGDFTGDKDQSPVGVISTDQATTGITIAQTPANNGAATNKGYVTVQVNGITVRLGSTTVAPAECYFSADGGVTARALDAVQAGDTLYWNTSVAGYGLVPADRVDFLYLIG